MQWRQHVWSMLYMCGMICLQTVDGWYYLLNEEIGQRKHLRVPVFSDVKPDPVSTDVGVHNPEMQDTSLLRRNTSSISVHDQDVQNTSILRPAMRTAINVGTSTQDAQDTSFQKPMKRNVSFHMGPPLSPAPRGHARNVSSLKPAPRSSSSIMRSSSCVSQFGRPNYQTGTANVKRLDTYQTSTLDRRVGLRERGKSFLLLAETTCNGDWSSWYKSSNGQILIFFVLIPPISNHEHIKE